MIIRIGCELGFNGTYRHTSKRPETAVDVVYDRVLPFNQQHKWPNETILTENAAGYKGGPMIHMY
jgi:hypothetical protein